MKIKYNAAAAAAADCCHFQDEMSSSLVICKNSSSSIIKLDYYYILISNKSLFFTSDLKLSRKPYIKTGNARSSKEGHFSPQTVYIYIYIYSELNFTKTTYALHLGIIPSHIPTTIIN